MAKINDSQRRMLFSIMHKAGRYHTRSEYLKSLTQGRVTSIKDLSFEEASAIATELQRELNKAESSLKPMRAKVVAILCSLNYLKDGKPNYDRINEWCKTMTAAKKPLLSQTYQELLATVNTAEQYERNMRNKPLDS